MLLGSPSVDSEPEFYDIFDKVLLYMSGKNFSELYYVW